MSTFEYEVEEKGYGHILSIHTFKEEAPICTDDVLEAFKDIVSNNRKVMIDPDVDPDGYFAGLTVKDTLDTLGHSNYKVNKHWEKRHGITDAIVSEAINEQYDYVIIVDSSTNSLDKLEKMAMYGVQVIVIDHHQTSYEPKDYGVGITVINNQQEIQKHLKQDLSKASACLLTALVMNSVLKRMGKEAKMIYYLYGYITLYSDSCSMDNKFNLALTQMTHKLGRVANDQLTRFMTKYDGWNRSFIEYGLVPKLNALVRSEQFEVLHRYFYEWNTLTEQEKEDLVIFIIDNYKATKELTEKLAKYTEVVQYGEYVIAYMDNAVKELELSYSKARNFTGVVASKIMNEYNKATITLISVNSKMYQGSVRDPFNRNLLKVFKQLIKAGGHPSAFGVEVNKNHLSSMINNLNRFRQYFQLTGNKTILINGDVEPNIFRSMNLIAEYNENSGGVIPVGYVTKVVTTDMKIYRHAKYTSIKWEDRFVTVFNTDVNYHDTLIIKPTVGLDETKLLVNTVMFNMDYER